MIQVAATAAAVMRVAYPGVAKHTRQVLGLPFFAFYTKLILSTGTRASVLTDNNIAV